MFGFGSGLVVGVVIATVGVNGVVRLGDNLLKGAQEQTRQAAYPNLVQQQPQREALPDRVQPQRVPGPTTSFEEYERRRYGY